MLDNENNDRNDKNENFDVVRLERQLEEERTYTTELAKTVSELYETNESLLESNKNLQELLQNSTTTNKVLVENQRKLIDRINPQRKLFMCCNQLERYATTGKDNVISL